MSFWIRGLFGTAVFLALASAALPSGAMELRDELARQTQPTELALLLESLDNDHLIVSDFYVARNFQPLWLADGHATPLAFAAQKALADAADDGLDPLDYNAEAINSLLAATRPDLLAQLELRLSIGMVRFLSDLGAGRLHPGTVDRELYVQPRDVDGLAILAALAGAGSPADIDSLVASFRPDQQDYQGLRLALREYRRLAALPQPAAVPEGKALKPGESDPRVIALRQRLAFFGEAAEPAPGTVSEFFDPALGTALRHFQARNGLAADGVAGRNTLDALNTSAAARAEQIMLNMERRRWVPDHPGERYIEVNLADYHLRLIENGEIRFMTRVVVGATYHRTPVFEKAMTYLVVNPYWNVPPSIAGKELLPKLKADPGPLAADGFEALAPGKGEGEAINVDRIDWSQYSSRSLPFMLRQRPGPGNALGNIKFMLPNRFNVYLHDTNAKALFEKPQRSASHGCIRVQYPDLLALEVLKGQPAWTAEKLQQTIATGRQTIVRLEQPLPVRITYQTTWVERDGTVNFRADVYGRDARLAQALLGPRANPLSR